MDSLESHSFLVYWKPRYSPRLPFSSDSTLISPIQLHWNCFSYPSLPQCIPPSPTISPQNLIGLQYALGSVTSSIGRSYLIARNLFLFLSLLVVVWGVLQLCFGNIFGVVNIVMTVVWAGLTRAMANRMMLAMGEGEVVMESKVEELSRAYLGAERTVKLGRNMQWIVVSLAHYNPPPLVTGVPVMMGVPV